MKYFVIIISRKLNCMVYVFYDRSVQEIEPTKAKFFVTIISIESFLVTFVICFTFIEIMFKNFKEKSKHHPSKCEKNQLCLN